MSKKLKPLELADAHHLKVAEGWIGSGDFVSACGKLEEISPEARAHPAVLLLRCHIYGETERWDMAAKVSDTLAKILPESASVWISFAYFTRRRNGGGIPPAKNILLEAAPKFPREFLFPYNCVP